jgi:DNA polymerase-3 subunit epsilon
MKSFEEVAFMLDELAGHGYKFTKEFKSREHYGFEDAPSNLLKAIVLDTETTGFDSASDKIIELGMVSFEYCPDTGKAYRVLEVFDELEDPHMPIPSDSIKVHGITDDMVQGKSIDDDAVQAFISQASLIIAHNAKFDRAFVEARFPFFEKKAWACSFAQVNWNEEGLGGSKLEFLAYKFGFHYTGHRASNDCHALLEVLQHQLPESGELGMKRLLDNARAKELKVSALNSRFESKDVLRQRGYRWNAEKKVWFNVINIDSLSAETEWLSAHVYNNKVFELELEKVDAFIRFSQRSAKSEIVKSNMIEMAV